MGSEMCIRDRSVDIFFHSETKLLRISVFMSNGSSRTRQRPLLSFCILHPMPIVRPKCEGIACPFTDLRLELVQSNMFRSAFRPLSSFPCPRSARTARHFHHITTDFITRDTRGNLVTRKVPIIIGNPEEAYVLIEREVGSAPCCQSLHINFCS